VAGDVVVHEFSQLIEVILGIMQIESTEVCTFVVHFKFIEGLSIFH